MLELYFGKLDEKSGLLLHQVEQDMRNKLKEFLNEELKLSEERQQGLYFNSNSTTRLYKFYKKNGGNVIELEVVHDGKTYTHKVVGFGSNKIMKPLAEKVTQLYDGYGLKKDSGGIIEGFEKI